MLSEEWLEFQLREPDWSIQIGDDPRYLTLLLVLTNMNQVFRLLYRNGVWLSAVVADEIGNLGLTALRAYERLARVSLDMGQPRFALYPKYHMLMHIFYFLVWRSARCAFIESPMTDNCQCCEGFIGNVARLSRRVSPKACVERTIAIYLISLWKHWTDRGWWNFWNENHFEIFTFLYNLKFPFWLHGSYVSCCMRCKHL